MRSALVGLLRLAGLAAPLLLGIGIGQAASPYLPGFAGWVETLGVWAPLAFVAAYVAVCVLMLPAFLFTMAAGAVFGIAKGALLVMTGATLGGVTSFLIARHLARERVRARVERNPTLTAIDRAVGDDGLRLMFLLRLSPAIPFVLANYSLGITRVRLRDYTAAMLGMLPTVFTYVAFGAASGPGTVAGTARVHPAILGLGIAATVALGLLLARITQRALRDANRRVG
jgi:uncharacterized membrane protein YdjX (TVP38/TMEM64 family)